uniref:Uncharacterized protein n=1 Tax=Knipowitschia caucasica TaxID=637954 RepID=A0AAV2JSC7_KNICA
MLIVVDIVHIGYTVGHILHSSGECDLSQTRPSLSEGLRGLQTLPTAIGHQQSRAAQSKAEQRSSEQSIPEQSKPEQPRAEQPRAEQPRAEQPRAEQPRAEQPRAELSRAGRAEGALCHIHIHQVLTRDVIPDTCRPFHMEFTDAEENDFQTLGT